MKVVNPETLSDSTDTTVIAVINVLFRVIVPELTLLTIVFRNFLVAFNAFLSSRLHLEAMHAHHCIDKVSVGDVRH